MFDGAPLERGDGLLGQHHLERIPEQAQWCCSEQRRHADGLRPGLDGIADAEVDGEGFARPVELRGHPDADAGVAAFLTDDLGRGGAGVEHDAVVSG